MKICKILFVFSILISSNAYSADLKLAIHEYPPFTSRTVKYNGLLSFFVKQVFEKEGHPVQIRSHYRSELFDRILDSGKVFAAFPVINTGGDPNLRTYSQSIMTAQYGYFFRKGLDVSDIDFTTMKGLEKYKVGALIADLVFDSVNNHPKVKLVKSLNPKELVSKLGNRSIDIIIFEKTSFHLFSKANGMTKSDDYEFVAGPWPTYPVHLAVSKKYPDWEKYLNIFNSALGKYNIKKMIDDYYY